METKKCNKCGKMKPLPEMTRRRNEETGEFKYLSLCKSCKAEYQKKYKIEKREAPKSKVCTCCKQEKPIDSFYKNIQTAPESGFTPHSARSAKERLTGRNME